jgi:site-specific DNA recombinase
VRGGLATADWRTRREIIRALVRRVEIDQQHVTVVFRVPPTASTAGPDGGILPDCRRGGLTSPGQRVPALRARPVV